MQHDTLEGTTNKGRLTRFISVVLALPTPHLAQQTSHKRRG